MKVKKITQNNDEFPTALKNIPKPPKELYYLGDLQPLLKSVAISIVGSRSISAYGKQVTTRLAGELAGQGITIVSGLALGVDATAHQAALDAGGYTVAVLPSTVSDIYPATNRQLAERILAAGGALISEYANNDTLQFRGNFIERNRLVSGLCHGLLITEASERSGTLHTANFALEQGKTVLAVPGNITSPTSAGTNNLLKSGATPVTCTDDILQALDMNRQISMITVIAANASEAAILDLIKKGMTDVNELQHHSKLSPPDFSQTLTMLEISAKVRPLGNGQWGLK